MSTITLPSFNQSLLQTIAKQAETEPVRTWPQPTLRAALRVLQEIRASALDMRRTLENELGAGVDPRSFVREYGDVLPKAEEYLVAIRELMKCLTPTEDVASESVVAELRL